MKILKRTLLLIVFLLLIHINCFADTGTINVSATRLREKPNTSSEILTVIYEDEKIEILGEENDWYKVSYNSYTGYVKKDFIKINSSNNEKNSNTNTNTSSNTNANTNVATNTNVIDNTETNKSENNSTNQNNTVPEKVTVKMNSSLRLLPSFMSRIVCSAEEGKEYDKINELNEWIQISDGTIIGWLPKTKLNLSEDAIKEDSNKHDSDTSNTAIDNTAQNNNENVTNSVKNETSSNTNTVSNSSVNNNTVTNETSKDTSGEGIPKSGKINVETARVREAASTSSEIIEGLDYGTTVEIIAENGDWYKIKSGNIEGYVSKKLISTSGNTTSRSLIEPRENENKTEEKDNSVVDTNQNNAVNTALQAATSSPAPSANGGSVVEFAKQFLGYPYVSAGKTPQTGFDCSGFTRYIFMNFGVTLGGSAASQVGAGTEVPREALSAGDLLLFYDEGRTKVGHTGIYIGNGDFIHAANPSRGVVIDNLNSSSYYNSRFITARRIVN